MPTRTNGDDEVRALAACLGRIDVKPVDRQVAALSVTLGAAYDLKAPDAIHLATAVEAGAVASASSSSAARSTTWPRKPAPWWRLTPWIRRTARHLILSFGRGLLRRFRKWGSWRSADDRKRGRSCGTRSSAAGTQRESVVARVEPPQLWWGEELLHRVVVRHAATAHIVYGVLDFGGSMGMGNKLFAIPFDRFHVGE